MFVKNQKNVTTAYDILTPGSTIYIFIFYFCGGQIQKKMFPSNSDYVIIDLFIKNGTHLLSIEFWPQFILFFRSILVDMAK